MTRLEDVLKQIGSVPHYYMYEVFWSEGDYGLYVAGYCAGCIAREVGQQLIAMGIATPMQSEDPKYPKWKLAPAAVRHGT